MKKLLYGNNVEKACKYCSRSKGRLTDKSVECDLKGSVPSDYKCRRFDYDPMLRVPRRKQLPVKMTADDFKL